MKGFKIVAQRSEVVEKQSLFDHIAGDWRVQLALDYTLVGYTLVDGTMVDFQNFVDQIAQDR